MGSPSGEAASTIVTHGRRSVNEHWDHLTVPHRAMDGRIVLAGQRPIGATAALTGSNVVLYRVTCFTGHGPGPCPS